MIVTNLETGEAANRKRFVLLFHDFPNGHQQENHWDLMLEWDETLITFALSEMLAPGKLIPAKPISDHRMLYLDYEGPVSNNRGSVTRVMKGDYYWISDDPLDRSDIAVLEFDDRRWKIAFEKSVAEIEMIVVVTEA